MRDYDSSELDALDQAEVSGIPLYAGGLVDWPARWADAKAIYAAETGKIRALHMDAE